MGRLTQMFAFSNATKTNQEFVSTNFSKITIPTKPSRRDFETEQEYQKKMYEYNNNDYIRCKKILNKKNT